MSNPTTLAKVTALLQKIANTPAPPAPTDTVGPLVPSTDILGAEINKQWQIPQGYGYRAGDIPGTWTVQQLSDDIDKRVAAVKAKQNPGA